MIHFKLFIVHFFVRFKSFLIVETFDFTFYLLFLNFLCNYLKVCENPKMLGRFGTRTFSETCLDPTEPIPDPCWAWVTDIFGFSHTSTIINTELRKQTHWWIYHLKHSTFNGLKCFFISNLLQRPVKRTLDERGNRGKYRKCSWRILRGQYLLGSRLIRLINILRAIQREERSIWLLLLKRPLSA